MGVEMNEKTVLEMLAGRVAKTPGARRSSPDRMKEPPLRSCGSCPVASMSG